jgi:hypothetical protein
MTQITLPKGEQIIAITPEYTSRRKHRPVSVMIILSNDEMVRQSLLIGNWAAYAV